jgi:hypothetical protein
MVWCWDNQLGQEPACMKICSLLLQFAHGLKVALNAARHTSRAKG